MRTFDNADRAAQTRFLMDKARWVRREVLEAAATAGRGHLGGTFSCTDLFVSLYYGGVLRFDPRNPRWPDRDRLLVGKGHACLALYAIFLDLGMISRKRYEEYGRDGGTLGAQLDITVPGVEYNTGSLGQVAGVAAGIALAAKMDSRQCRAFALMGDAELYEGAVWEAIAFAGEHRLDKLVCIVDRNRLSVTDVVGDDGLFKDFATKLRAFDWDYYEMDGHSFPEILGVAERLKTANKPSMVVANTVKGKGVSFMENEIRWHHAMPGPDQLLLARKELGQAN